MSLPQQNKQNSIPIPKYLQIEPVGQCNLRCQMCSIQFREDGPPFGPPAFMDFAVFTQILDQFPEVETLHLQGLGEPMMHPRFFNMVNYAKDRGIRVTTNTNLTLINRKRAQACVTSGLDEIHVSIDGATPETYERIRKRARFDKVIRNLDLLLQARDYFAGAAGHLATPRLKMVMVIMRQNLKELPDLVRLAHRWQMDQIFVQHLSHDFGENGLPEKYKPMREFVDAETLLGVSIDEINQVFSQAKNIAADLDIDLRLPRPRPRLHPPGTPGPDRCDWPWKGAYITYDGYALPCCMVSTPDRINMGNVAELGVEKIWNGETYQAFRDQLSSDIPSEICSSCSIYRGTF